MDKTKSKNKSLLELALALCLFLVAGYFVKENIAIQSAIDSYENENISLSKNVELLNQDLEELNNNYSLLLEEVETKRAIIEECKQNKQIFFDNILKLEEKVLDRTTNIRIAYLTIDDGPNIGTTKDWLEILKEYDVLATFFVNKKEWCDAEYRAMLDNHHTLANHTASHVFGGEEGVYHTSDNMVNNLKENYDFILDNYGYELKLMRFPGGSGEIKYLGQDKEEFVSKVKEAGYGYVDWNVSSGDGRRGQEVQTYVNNVLRDAYYTKIATVLMHDDSINTIKALPQIIKGLENMGYVLLPMQAASKVVK